MRQKLADRSPFFYGWYILGAAGTANFARNAAASLTISVFIYPLSEELGWSRTLIAGAAAAGGLVATFTSPVIGRMIDRYGARTVLTASVVVLCISTFVLRWSDVSLTLMGATIPWVFYIAFATGRVIFGESGADRDVGGCFSLVYSDAGSNQWVLGVCRTRQGWCFFR